MLLLCCAFAGLGQHFALSLQRFLASRLAVCCHLYFTVTGFVPDCHSLLGLRSTITRFLVALVPPSMTGGTHGIHCSARVAGVVTCCLLPFRPLLLGRKASSRKS